MIYEIPLIQTSLKVVWVLWVPSKLSIFIDCHYLKSTFPSLPLQSTVLLECCYALCKRTILPLSTKWSEFCHFHAMPLYNHSKRHWHWHSTTQMKLRNTCNSINGSLARVGEGISFFTSFSQAHPVEQLACSGHVAYYAEGRSWKSVGSGQGWRGLQKEVAVWTQPAEEQEQMMRRLAGTEEPKRPSSPPTSIICSTCTAAWTCGNWAATRGLAAPRPPPWRLPR